MSCAGAATGSTTCSTPIDATGYGLTLGIHSRIDETVRCIHARLRVGNAYVNRNMIGAVVGVQPFGGEGLSGTGPKAGGPHYLHRFATERTLSVDTTAAGGNASLLSLRDDEDVSPAAQGFGMPSRRAGGSTLRSALRVMRGRATLPPERRRSAWSTERRGGAYSAASAPFSSAIMRSIMRRMVHAVGVRCDVDQALLAKLAQPRLLRLDHRPCPRRRSARSRDRAARSPRARSGGSRWRTTRNRSTSVSVSGVRPWNRRNWKPPSRLPFVGAGADIGGAGPLQDAAGRDPLEFLPAIDPALEARGLHIGRRRHRVAHPAGELDAARACASSSSRPRHAPRDCRPPSWRGDSPDASGPSDCRPSACSCP